MQHTDTNLQKAHVLLEQRRPREAEKFLSKVLQEDPENISALSLMGRCKYDQKQYQDGVELVRSAIRINPYEHYYFYLLSFGYYQLNRNAEAVSSLKQAISMNPYASDYFGLLALIHLDDKQFEPALEMANAGLAMDAKNITCLNARSTALNKLKRTEDAIETMQHALAQDPENDYTHTNIGWNLLEKGKHLEASHHFTEALRLNPNLENARLGLKESLKSRLPIYRWILQYSFWINNQGKQARWIIPVGLYIVVRLIAGAGNAAGGNWGITGLIVIAIYILFVFTSWVINPLANFMLLFNSRGKYAVTNREKWNSILLISSVIMAVGFFIAGLFAEAPVNQVPPLLICAIVALTLGIPLGHMDFPLRPRNNSTLQWYSMLVVSAGLLTILLTFIHRDAGFAGLIIYGVGFIAYTWWNIFSNKT